MKDGVSIEIMADKHISYMELAVLCSTTLEMPDPPINHHLALLTTGGAVIQETDEWTLGGYMKQQYRGPSKLRIGVGYIETAGVGHLYPIQIPHLNYA